jgi:hypothetical protein
LFRSGEHVDYTRMRIMNELEHSGDAADACPRKHGCAARVHKRAIANRGRQFLEQARHDPWRANVVIQLAESVGDHVDSLSSYIDMLLATAALLLRHEDRKLDGGDASDRRPGSPVKYLSWFNELGALERSRLADREREASAHPICRRAHV